MAIKTLSTVTCCTAPPRKNWTAYQTVCTAVVKMFFCALVNDLCFFDVIWWISRNNLAILIHEKRYTFPTHWIFHYMKSKSGNNWCDLNPSKPLTHLQLNQLSIKWRTQSSNQWHIKKTLIRTVVPWKSRTINAIK